jgi:hypothetical protein
VIVYLAFAVLMIASLWKVFTKAGEPGWAALIPFYNFYVMLRIGNNPGWYLLLMFVPLANLYAFAKMYSGLAKAFGKGIGWAIGLWILSFIFFPLLAFGDYRYQGSQDAEQFEQVAV